MLRKISSSGQGQIHRAVDITDAVHFRMVSDSVRESLATRGSLTEDEDNIVLHRLFPSMRKEALVRFLARGERGAVICSEDRIEYAPEHCLAAMLQAQNTYIELTAAVRSYDPLLEAVVVITNEDFSKIPDRWQRKFPGRPEVMTWEGQRVSGTLDSKVTALVGIVLSHTRRIGSKSLTAHPACTLA